MVDSCRQREKNIVRYIDDHCSIGAFRLQDGYLLFDGGTSEERSIYIYGIENNFKFNVSAFAWGKKYILINSKLNKVATQLLGNKDFHLGFDDAKTARVGIRVTDFITGETKELIPTTDVNFILYSFEDQLLYKDNGEIKVFDLE